MQMLMETVSAADQENKRRPTSTRAGSVPACATTPVNSASTGYVPGAKTGVVTPAVRTREQAGGGSGSQSVPSKRQRIGGEQATSTPVYGVRAPLGAHRGVNGGGNGNGHLRSSSPTKIPSKSLSGGGASGLPRPATMGMVVPKPGTQHHALGHGRVPTSVIYGTGAYAPGGMGVRSASVSVSGYGSAGRAASGGGYGKMAGVGVGAGAGGMAKKATRAKRESFKPRPSVDAMDMGVSVGHGTKRWDGGFTVNEDEEY